MATPQEPGAPRWEEPRVLSSEPCRETMPLLPVGSLSIQFLLSSQAPGTGVPASWNGHSSGGGRQIDTEDMYHP